MNTVKLRFEDMTTRKQRQALLDDPETADNACGALGYALMTKLFDRWWRDQQRLQAKQEKMTCKH